jgi:2-(1,2-epoxy-1,2-dihydrophenyl)acetyl-CoA isomerase
MSANQYSSLLTDRVDNVVTVTLNRPDKLNALSIELADELSVAAAHIAADQTIRAVILTGAGRAFCAGADLSANGKALLASTSRKSETHRRMRQNFNPAIQAWHDLPIPVLAAVNGVAAGAGVSLALTADVVIAARSATFMQVFAPKLGLIPDLGATFFMPRMIGTARAKGLALFGNTLTAEQAAQWGLIWESIDDDKLAATVQRHAETLAQGPTKAFSAIKRVFNQSNDTTLLSQLEVEAELQGELADTADFAEGLSAFLEKRPTKFSGI